MDDAISFKIYLWSSFKAIDEEAKERKKKIWQCCRITECGYLKIKCDQRNWQ